MMYVDHFRDLLMHCTTYINCWEDQMIDGSIGPEEFLTKQTAQGLRVTITLTIDLSKYY